MPTKRDLADLRRAERRSRRRRELACFWSWPPGHVRDAFHVCMSCGHDARLPVPAEVVVVRERVR